MLEVSGEIMGCMYHKERQSQTLNGTRNSRLILGRLWMFIMMHGAKNVCTASGAVAQPVYLVSK